jgi:hypothetical protein
MPTEEAKCSFCHIPESEAVLVKVPFDCNLIICEHCAKTPEKMLESPGL